MNSPGQRHAGESVQLARAQLGLSQADLAAKARVNASTLSFLETGKRWPRPPSQLRITRALGWPDGQLEKIARSYVAEPAADDDQAAVVVLRDAMTIVERHITDSDLKNGLKVKLIREIRERGIEQMIQDRADRGQRRTG